MSPVKGELGSRFSPDRTHIVNTAEVAVAGVSVEE